MVSLVQSALPRQANLSLLATSPVSDSVFCPRLPARRCLGSLSRTAPKNKKRQRACLECIPDAASMATAAVNRAICDRPDGLAEDIHVDGVPPYQIAQRVWERSAGRCNCRLEIILFLSQTDLWCGSRCIRRRYKSLSDCVCLIVRWSLQPLVHGGVDVLSSGAHRMPHRGAPIASAETDGAWSDNLAAASAYRR